MFNEEWSGAVEEISKYGGKSHGVSTNQRGKTVLGEATAGNQVWKSLEVEELDTGAHGWLGTFGGLSV